MEILYFDGFCDLVFDAIKTKLAKYVEVEKPSLSRAISEMVHNQIIAFGWGKGEILNSDAPMSVLL